MAGDAGSVDSRPPQRYPNRAHDLPRAPARALRPEITRPGKVIFAPRARGCPVEGISRMNENSAAASAGALPLAAAANDSKDTRRRIGAIFGGSIGNLVEWYDWYVYATFALYFSHAFF